MTMWWILVTRLHSEQYNEILIGPFDSEAEANGHLDSTQVNHFAQEDAQDIRSASSDEVLLMLREWDAEVIPIEFWAVTKDETP